MFGIFKKKKSIKRFKILESSSNSPQLPSSIDYSSLFKKNKPFLYFDREKVRQAFDNIDEEQLADTVYESIQSRWVADICRQLGKSSGKSYTIYQSSHFELVTCENEKYVDSFIKSMENIHQRISKALGSIYVNDETRLPIFIIDNNESYYEYISNYYPEEGTFAQSSGVFLRDIVPHFVFPKNDYAISVASHELTHALVSHLEIPLWLNEGLAVNMESVITGSNPFKLNQQKHQQHIAFWGETEIQEFWSGKSFSRPDEANELSYQLAQLITRTLAENHAAFYAFVNDAHYTDSGEKALSTHYGISLADIITNVFGDGNWKPDPQHW